VEASPEPTDPSDPARAGRSSRIGLALAGGAPGGAVYEIGALYALDEALGGNRLNDLTIYVGVSSGALLGACLANGITPAQMCRILAGAESDDPPFVADAFLQPAFQAMRRGVWSLPALFAGALWDYVSRFGSYTLLESMTRLSQALPVGLFDNEPVREYLVDVFSRPGRTDDFRQLRRPLVVVATDLDSGLAARFGEPGLDHVPISRAVQASAALPGLYPPVEIDGRQYVDGILLKTLHASVALEKGADLVLCVNPIVPIDTVRAIEQGVLPSGTLRDRGLPTVLAQTFRTLIYSRMAAGLAAYETRFRGADVVLLEPERHDYRMFFTNIFGFEERIQVCEHAYQATRETLLARFDELTPILARHGLTLNRDALCGERDLWAQVGAPEAGIRKANKKQGPRSARSPRSSPGQAVVHRLDDALSRLDRLVGERLS
jgi:NTE family protein